MNRRSFLKLLLAAITAPFVSRASKAKPQQDVSLFGYPVVEKDFDPPVDYQSIKFAQPTNTRFTKISVLDAGGEWRDIQAESISAPIDYSKDVMLYDGTNVGEWHVMGYPTVSSDTLKEFTVELVWDAENEPILNVLMAQDIGKERSNG
jgi:hypothetical protein